MSPRCLELSMPRLGKTGRLRVCAPATAARDRDADIYLRYAVGMYRQALSGALPHVRVGAVLRRLTTSPAAAGEDGNPNE
jgi:hypothetical protein